GKYLFEVIDLPSNRLLYSRGFASIYGEWETTGEARRGVWRTFHESQRFPEPIRKCQLVIKKRTDDGTFREIFATLVDPASRFINRSPVLGQGRVWTVLESGAASDKVDVLVLGDGYAQDEMEKFHRDVQRLVSELFAVEPFRSRKNDFNVRAIDLVSASSAISDPRRRIWRKSALGLSFNAFDSDRYVLTFANKRVREVSAQVPYDSLIIVFNGRKYGGGGIFNLWATCSSDTEPAPYIFVHEFGHSFAGLGDEYYTSQVAYENFTKPGVEPWEPNITALLDPARLKWADLVEEKTPVPTPWDQAGYDEVSLAYQAKRRKLVQEGRNDAEMEALFREVKATTGPMLASERYAAKIGAFEGAGYRPKGLFRPAVDCIMFTRNRQAFCQVCSRAIERVIDLYNR
ncbi:MAG: M64 family metallopeptidase, partial [Acidobacteriota bacterium]